MERWSLKTCERRLVHRRDPLLGRGWRTWLEGPLETRVSLAVDEHVNSPSLEMDKELVSYILVGDTAV